MFCFNRSFHRDWGSSEESLDLGWVSKGAVIMQDGLGMRSKEMVVKGRRRKKKKKRVGMMKKEGGRKSNK